MLVKCQEEKRKIGKKESWSKQEAAVNSWKHLYKENETFKQPSPLLKVKEFVDKHVQPKTVIQIKSKLRIFKGFLCTIDNPS